MNDAMLVTLRNESQFHHLVVAVGDYPLSSPGVAARRLGTRKVHMIVL